MCTLNLVVMDFPTISVIRVIPLQAGLVEKRGRFVTRYRSLHQ